MKTNKFIIFFLALFTLLCVGAIFILLGFNLNIPNFGWLNPQGFVATEQKSLLIKTTLIMFVITLPAMFLIYFFAFKFRAKNNQAYEPEKKTNNFVVTAIWSGPIIIILIITILLWQSVHKLDPMKNVVPGVKPMTIQVVSLQYKWLFLYPKEGIATVNYVEFPVNTPVEFQLTAESPMNSFWIPQLGGQMYAMTGMVNKLNLIADKTGEFPGSTAEMSGSGFAGMRFNTKVVSQTDYEAWVASVQGSPQMLMQKDYDELSKPGTVKEPIFYYMYDPKLYNTIIDKFMVPAGHQMQMDKK